MWNTRECAHWEPGAGCELPVSGFVLCPVVLLFSSVCFLIIRRFTFLPDLLSQIQYFKKKNKISWLMGMQLFSPPAFPTWNSCFEPKRSLLKEGGWVKYVVWGNCWQYPLARGLGFKDSGDDPVWQEPCPEGPQWWEWGSQSGSGLVSSDKSVSAFVSLLSRFPWSLSCSCLRLSWHLGFHNHSVPAWFQAPDAALQAPGPSTQ